MLISKHTSSERLNVIAILLVNFLSTVLKLILKIILLEELF